MDVIATEPQYRAHLAPIVDRLPDLDVTLVASYSDLVRARKRGAERIVLAQHGAGQSYGGDPRSERHPAYPGGDDNGDVGLFLVPNEHAARRWQEAYRNATVRIVGCPKLDVLPERQIDPISPHPVVAISFHSEVRIVPEARSSFGWYARGLPALAERYKVIGHAHPRAAPAIARTYKRLGIEWVPDFDEVCRRADVYLCDNSSTLFEFAATGRPVVILNAPWYRRDVRHGLRFWEGSLAGGSVNHPDDLCDAVDDALRYSWQFVREAVVDHVYAYREGAAQRAADAILEWAA